MDYILFGIQGSGKGTQGKILMERIKAAYFETGGELRRLAKEDSPLGKKIKAIIEAGRLVPNEVVMEMVGNFIKTKASACAAVFDGLPRNAEQGKTFEALLQKTGRQYTGIYFELPRAEAERRLLTRRMCAKCKAVYPSFYKNPTCEKCNGELVTRADDNADSIRTRIEVFYNETVPVIEDWRKRGKMISVNGTGTIEEVTKGLLSALKL